MKSKVKDAVRDAGYEVLFLLGGFLAASVDPTSRNLDRVLQWVDESVSERARLRELEKRGLVESGVSDGRWVPRLTALGRAVFAGGRHPEVAWNRPWDGNWRLLTFDLPREESSSRMKLRRWLISNHVGRLQGSVWIAPDPIEGIGDVLDDDVIDPSMVLVFEGGLAGGQKAREISALAWDFGSINEAYRDYADVTERVLRQVQGKAPSRLRLRRILDEDRKRWWDAVRLDPLLPKPLLPKGYEGVGAWGARCKLLKKLGASLGG